MMMTVIVAATAGTVMGFALGLLLGKREANKARATLLEQERILREVVVPGVEMRARDLGVAFVSIPPPDMSTRAPNVAATVAHLANLSRGIAEKEQANSVALSDTVQMQKADLAPLAKLKSG